MANKNCLSDNDCNENYLCAFNEDTLNHYCISSDINDLYYGCIDNNNIDKVESIESKSKIDHLNYKNCIDFSRRQVNNENIEYNYMIYKPKKNVYVDTTTINIYLKCEDKILAIIPYNDYFNLKCDENQEICKLESKESLYNFIIQNSKNCKNIYLELIYECENEGVKKNEKIMIDTDNYKNIIFNLECPVDKTNDKFKSKCQAIYIDNYINKNNKDYIDTTKTLYECKNPLYNIPRVIKNINNYKKLKKKRSNIELNEYTLKINEKVEDLKKLETEKYIKLKKEEDGIDITFNDAYEEINKFSLDKIVNNFKEKWKLYQNYDAVQNLFSDNENDIIKYYGLVYTIDDVIKIANDNNENFFVWYHNSYELDNYSSKLFFINIYNINEDLMIKDNWVSNENVTTGLIKFEKEYFDVTDSLDNNENEELTQLRDQLDMKDSENIKLRNDYYDIIDKTLNYKDLNNNIIKNLDNKITTISQSVSMNNYETNINNNILIALIIILVLLSGIFLVLMVYYNNKTAGKIKLFNIFN